MAYKDSSATMNGQPINVVKEWKPSDLGALQNFDLLAALNTEFAGPKLPVAGFNFFKFVIKLATAGGPASGVGALLFDVFDSAGTNITQGTVNSHGQILSAIPITATIVTIPIVVGPNSSAVTPNAGAGTASQTECRQLGCGCIFLQPIFKITTANTGGTAGQCLGNIWVYAGTTGS